MTGRSIHEPSEPGARDPKLTSRVNVRLSSGSSPRFSANCMDCGAGPDPLPMPGGFDIRLEHACPKLVIYEATDQSGPDEWDDLLADADALVESWDRKGSWSADSPVGLVMQLARALRQATDQSGSGGSEMSRTTGEAMLVAAMEENSAELERLAQDFTATERRNLTRALNLVYDALVKAEREDANQPVTDGES